MLSNSHAPLVGRDATPLQGAREPTDTRVELAGDLVAYVDLWPQGIMDALPFAGALVDGDGVMLAVNTAWRRNARAADGHQDDAFLGRLYIEAFEALEEAGDGEEEETRRLHLLTGLKGVLNGQLSSFTLKYASTSSSGERWTRLVISPAEVHGEPGALILHLDVTREHAAPDTLALVPGVTH